MKRAFLILGGIMLLAACKKKADDEPAQTYIIVTVLDGKSYSATTPTLSTVSGAEVDLYASQSDVTSGNAAYGGYTYTSGDVVMPVAYKSAYYVVVKKGTESNIYNNWLVAGIFGSQQEIQQSPVQTPTPTVGSVKYTDVNGDGKIDQNDYTNSAVINVQQGATTNATAVIYGN